jgi:predicted metalloprotease with PDZ domain
MVLEWNDVVLYPAGTPAEQQSYEAKLLLPDGWKFGTSLPIEKQSGKQVSFKPISLDMLVDSPVIAGEYYRAIDITPPGEPIHHEIDMAADSEAALNMSPENQKQMVNLVAESGKLFGARHYRDYHFILALSDHVAHFGLEHHESNDSRLPERALLLPSSGMSLGGLLAHEFVHSWNGKFRRPADLTTLLRRADGNGSVVGLRRAHGLPWAHAGRAQRLVDPGAISRSDGRHCSRAWTGTPRPHLAPAARHRHRRARRGIRKRLAGQTGAAARITTTKATCSGLKSPPSFIAKRHGQKSIDDFCQAFHGGPNHGAEVKTYTFDELVSTLNAIAPFDWAGFFHTRLNSTSADAPTGGIENGGWKVVLNTEPMKLQGRNGDPGDVYSIGLKVGTDGAVTDAIVGSPAFEAGVSSGMKVIGVNGRVYSHDLLDDAIKAAKDTSQPVTLLVVADDYFRTCVINYHGGDKFPHLVRVADKPDYLDELIKPRAATQ